MERHLLIFVRAPVLGAVKRRLAAEIGLLGARAFYIETTRQVIRRVGHDNRWTTWLAVTPDSFTTRGRFWPQTLRRFPQGSGDLGDRMGRALRQLGPLTVIVGSDIPGVNADHIFQAFRALAQADLVFGPARDGGYWLVGARRSGATGGLFRNVRWSSAHALADTLANAKGRRIAMLDVLEDVDTAADLVRIGIAPQQFSVLGGAEATRRNCRVCAGYRAGP